MVVSWVGRWEGEERGKVGEREFVGLGFELFFFCAREDVEIDELVFEDFDHADGLDFERYFGSGGVTRMEPSVSPLL